MKKVTARQVRKPNAFLYYGVTPFLKLFFQTFYRLRIDRSDIKDLKPPYLVVAGHSCWFDYIIVGSSLFPTRLNFVGAYNFFRDRTLASLFKHLGVIPKFQYTKDIQSIKMMKLCVDDGGALVLFPHGCLSNDGRPGGYASIGVAKLVKFLDVPVVSVKTDGGYLTRPRWTKTSRRGRIETKVSVALTIEQVRDLSSNEIYERLMESIRYDDYKWQRERMIPFKAMKPAEGVEFVLYKCPKCESEFSLYSEDNRLTCRECGNTVIMNKYLLFEPADSKTVLFDGIDKWFDYQIDCLFKEISNPAFCMEAATELRYNDPGHFGYQPKGRGVLTMTRDAVTYTGSVEGNENVLTFPMTNIQMMPYAAGEYIEIADGGLISRFIFDDKPVMMKWVLALRLIRDKFYEEFKHYEETQ